MTERYLPAQLRVGSGHALICQRFSGEFSQGIGWHTRAESLRE
jgi:hypothetical protein